MAVDKSMTEKLQTYFHKNGLYRATKLSNRQQKQIQQDTGCTSVQLVEYVLFNCVSKVETKEAK